MASMQGHFRPSRKPKPHMLAGPLAIIKRNKKSKIIRSQKNEILLGKSIRKNA